MQRARFLEIARVLPEPMLLVAVDGRILAANPAARAALAFLPAPLDAQSLPALAADPPARVADYLARCARTRELIPGAITLRSEGKSAAFGVRGALLFPRSEAGGAAVVLRLEPKSASVSKFVLLNQKIDELKREITRRGLVEAALREREEWLRVVLSSIGDAVIATDARGDIAFMNPVAEALSGWREDEARGRPLAEVFVIVNEETGAPVESPVDKVLREGCIVGLANHTELITKTGEHIPIDDSAAPIRDLEGGLHGVVLVFHEISERKQAEREREGLLLREKAARLAAEEARVAAEEARGEAESMNRAKDAFLSTLSHELRTPLTAILGWLNILRTTPPDPERFERGLATIERNANAQAHLIEDILDVSRIITGKLSLNIRVVDLHTVVRSALDVVRPSVEAKGITLEHALDPEAAVVHGDADRLQQVAWNLLSNAVKFTPKGGHVRLTLAREGPSVALRVRDTGEGIRADFLPHVFERFRQADASHTRVHGGLGLGLAIVKHLVELHGGTITAESEGVGRGAVFTVVLPVSDAVTLREGASDEGVLS